jgi:hypothetical protein
MKSIFLKKLAEQKIKSTTKNITKQQGKKILETKKKLNDELKEAGNVGRPKYNILNRKLSETNNITEAGKIIKDMKDFIKDVKVGGKKVRKGQFATMEEARQAAKDAGKKTFNFGGKKNIPIKKVRNKLSELTKGMSKEEKASFKSKRGNELRSLKNSQKKEMLSDKYGGGTSSGGVRVQKLTPEGEKLLNEGKINQIVNAQKFLKLTKKVKENGKIVTKQIFVPTNKYVVEGIDAPLIPKGAKPIGKEEKRKMNQYFQNEMDDSQRLDYIMDRYEPQYTSSQLADILGITARDLTATLKKAGKYKQIMGDEGSIPTEGFQTRMITKDMKTGGIVKYKSGTGRTTIGKLKKSIKKPLRAAMGGLGAYEVYDVGKYAMDTLGPLMGFKSGTKGKTIKGCGKAIRGFGKAMINKKGKSNG